MKTIAAMSVVLLSLASFSTQLAAEDAGGTLVAKNATGANVFSYRPPSRGAPVSRVGGGTRGALYIPPSRGAPASRVGGGTRGTGPVIVELSALAPEHTGLTTRDQPTLYWYLSDPVDARLDVTLIDEKKIDPIMEQVIGIPETAGIQSLDLAKAGTTLEPGIEYRWFVSLTPDEKQRSNDIVASGTIEYIKPDTALENRITGSDELALARIYAEGGIWYDAIDSLSDAIRQNPGDAGLHAQRAALLDQEGLTSAADFDRK